VNGHRIESRFKWKLLLCTIAVYMLIINIIIIIIISNSSSSSSSCCCFILGQNVFLKYGLCLLVHQICPTLPENFAHRGWPHAKCWPTNAFHTYFYEYLYDFHTRFHTSSSSEPTVIAVNLTHKTIFVRPQFLFIIILTTIELAGTVAIVDTTSECHNSISFSFLILPN
jgi:hypothetical protein